MVWAIGVDAGVSLGTPLFNGFMLSHSVSQCCGYEKKNPEYSFKRSSTLFRLPPFRKTVRDYKRGLNEKYWTRRLEIGGDYKLKLKLTLKIEGDYKIEMEINVEIEVEFSRSSAWLSNEFLAIFFRTLINFVSCTREKKEKRRPRFDILTVLASRRMKRNDDARKFAPRRSRNNVEDVVILHGCARIILTRANRDNCTLFINEDETARRTRQQNTFLNWLFLPSPLYSFI